MILTKSGEDGLRNRRKHATLANITVRDFWREPDRPEWPHAYLVEQAAHSTIQPHFHAVNQFQVIVQGGGRLGRHEVGPVTVHYADAFTGYGPITSRDVGLSYFTLRTMFDTGMYGLPESRAVARRLRVGPRRHRVNAIDLADRSTPARHDLIPPEPDGLLATVLRLRTDEVTTMPEPAEGAGQYLLVLAGSAVVRGDVLGKWSCVFLTSGERPIPIGGGLDGAHVLIMRFPQSVMH